MRRRGGGGSRRRGRGIWIVSSASFLVMCSPFGMKGGGWECGWGGGGVGIGKEIINGVEETEGEGGEK